MCGSRPNTCDWGQLYQNRRFLWVWNIIHCHVLKHVGSCLTHLLLMTACKCACYVVGWMYGSINMVLKEASVWVLEDRFQCLCEKIISSCLLSRSFKILWLSEQASNTYFPSSYTWVQKIWLTWQQNCSSSKEVFAPIPLNLLYNEAIFMCTSWSYTSLLYLHIYVKPLLSFYVSWRNKIIWSIPCLKSGKYRLWCTTTHGILHESWIKCTWSSTAGVSISIKVEVLLVWSIQVCVNTMPWRTGISNDLREAVIRFGPCNVRLAAKKKTRATSQTPQASVSVLNVKVHDSTIRRRLTKYGFHNSWCQNCIRINHKTAVTISFEQTRPTWRCLVIM